MQRPWKLSLTSETDNAEQRPPLPTRQSTPANMQRPWKPNLTSETDNAEQRPPLLIRRSGPANGRVGDKTILHEALEPVHNNGSIAPPGPPSSGPTTRSFNPPNARLDHRTPNPSRPNTSDPGTTHSPVSPTSSSDKGPALPKRPGPPKPPKPRVWCAAGISNEDTSPRTNHSVNKS